jgi:hypothetical protein
VREIGFPNTPGRTKDSDNAGRIYDREEEVGRFILAGSAGRHNEFVVHIIICASTKLPSYILQLGFSSHPSNYSILYSTIDCR